MGSSGSGKTTLVQWVHKEFGIPWINGSSGVLKTPKQIKSLKDLVGEYDGHKDVIKLGFLNPEFGRKNQEIILSQRIKLIEGNPEFITDRSPIDNIVYAMTQVAAMQSEAWCKSFIKLAFGGMEDLTHIIYVKAVQPKEFGIEDNNSRVANRYYQKTIDAVFDYWFNYYLSYINKHQIHLSQKVLVIDWWDLDKRKEEVMQFLSI